MHSLHNNTDETALKDQSVNCCWRPLREDEYGLVSTPTYPRSRLANYGVAVDLGTSHIRLSLWDLQTKTRLTGITGLNPQSSYGTDVLIRLMLAMRSPETAQDISRLAQTAIGQGLAQVVSTLDIDKSDIDEVLVVGNTAMLTLLSGKNHGALLQPENWTARVDCLPDDSAKFRRIWGVSDSASIDFIVPVGGFVGSDLLAGVVATQLTKQPRGSLLIDFGANSEIALWDGRSILVTSVAGGPAFEGSGISCGMPGETGAVYRVKANDDHRLELKVLGDGEPKGLCGSGLVDSVAILRRNGQLDRIGRLSGGKGKSGVMLHSNACQISLNGLDIDMFQRAKAAIAASVIWLCDLAGIRISEIKGAHACGAFGQLLDVANAQFVGLLPQLPVGAVALQGNTALAGCEMLLLSDQRSETLKSLLDVTHVHNMGEELSFEPLFIENLYLQPIHD